MSVPCNNLSRIIEALLFVSGEPISIKKLSDLSGSKETEVLSALNFLEETFRTRGLRLLKKEECVSLVTAPELSLYVEQLIKSEILGELSKSSLETLTIIAYKHPVSRSEIDYIRGVNSSFTLRNLMIRGLVERIQNSRDGRTYLYRPTIECMKFLGISSVQELPEYKQFIKELSEETLTGPVTYTDINHGSENNS